MQLSISGGSTGGGPSDRTSVVGPAILKRFWNRSNTSDSSTFLCSPTSTLSDIGESTDKSDIKVGQKRRYSKMDSQANVNSSNLEPLEKPDTGSCIGWESIGEYRDHNDDEHSPTFTEPGPRRKSTSETLSDSHHPLQNSIQTLQNWEENSGVADHGTLNDMVQILIDGTFSERFDFCALM